MRRDAKECPMLRLTTDWVWDSWIADDGELYHLFFLKAPSSLEDPALRHERATVGHATSRDLVTWDYLGETFGPAESGWDDLAIWTGSVVRGDDGRWHLFYTALSTERGHGMKDQRIGHAVSTDLHRWERVGDSPVVSPDPRWYTTLDDDPEASETWRDPFVFRDPDGDGWHMLITARASGAARHDDGIVGHARSSDLYSWEVEPPLSEPGHGFGQLEVLQVRLVDGQPFLIFTCHPQEMTQSRLDRSGMFCTWIVPGRAVTGPWDLAAARPLTADPSLFAAPLVQRRDGTWAFLGFRNTEAEGILSFEIIDPLGVRLATGSEPHLEPL
jgi:beta-fructofuranosidase